jgi:hypothetical protein
MASSIFENDPIVQPAGEGSNAPGSIYGSDPIVQPAGQQGPQLRPLGPGEYRQNPDGSISTEITASFNIDGRETVIPTLWMSPDGPVELSPDDAINAAQNYERQTGKQFPRFDSVAEADAFTRKRHKPFDAARTIEGALKAWNEAPPLATAPAPEPSAMDQLFGAIGRTVQGEAPPIVNQGLPGPEPMNQLFTEMTGTTDKREQFLRSLPIIAATAGSVAVPPLAAGRALPLIQNVLPGFTGRGLAGLIARGGLRFGPNALAAGAGGAVGGGAAEAMRGGSAGDIAGAAVRSGLEMGAAELAGSTLGAGAARLVAPAKDLIDDVGARALKFARESRLPGSGRPITGIARGLPIAPRDVAPGTAQEALQNIADLLLPSRYVTQRARRKVVARVLDVAPEGKANEVIRRLIHADTSIDKIADRVAVAKKAARFVGQETADRLGYIPEGKKAATTFVSRLFESGEAVGLKNRMAAGSFDDLLTTNLESMLIGSTRNVGGRQIIDGDVLLAAWRGLSDATRNLYPKATQEAFENFAAYAAASRRVPELAAQGYLTFGSGVTTAGIGAVGAPVVAAGLGAGTASTGGLGAGIAALTARSLMSPSGYLNRYLTATKLPADVIQIIGGQTVKTLTRQKAQEKGPSFGLLGP